MTRTVTIIKDGDVFIGEVDGDVIQLPDSVVRSRAMSLSILSILAVIALILAVCSLIWSQYPLLQVSVILICVGLLVANK